METSNGIAGPQKEVGTPQTEIEDLADHLREYIGMRRELVELKVLNKIFRVSASAVQWGVMLYIAITFLFFVSIGAALWINEALGSRFTGFFIVAGFYLVLGIFAFLFRDKLIRKPVANRIIDHIVNEDEDDDGTAHESTDHES